MARMGNIMQMATRVAPDSDSNIDRKPEVELPEYLDDGDPIVVKYSREGVLGFFSGLERAAADQIERLAENIVYSEEEEKVVTRKIDFRLLPIIVLSYITNQFDRTNIANAHVLPAFNRNFGISNNPRWTVVLSVFYIGYSLVEIPSNILERHIGANRFFFLGLTWWGLCSLSFVYTKGYTAAIVLRILLGFGESGFYAGTIYYLSFWYNRRELAFRISLCMSGTIAAWMSSFLAFGVLHLQRKTFASWQFLYLTEALPSLIMAVIILLFLPAFPFTAKFLTKKQRVIAVARLNHRPKCHGGSSGWEAVRLVLTDLHCWGFVVIYSSSKLLTIFQNVCVATVSYFLPTLISKLGYNPIQTQGLAVGPYFVGMIIVWVQSWHSDKTRDRGYHVMGSAMISVVGYVILAIYSQKNHVLSYLAMYLVVAGNWSLFPLVMSWSANTTSPTPKRGVGTAFIVSISNLITIASPQIYFDPQDSFRRAHWMSAGLMLLTFLTAFSLRMRLSYLNKKRDKMHPPNQEPVPEMSAAGVFEDFPDTDVRYRYMT